MKKRMSMMLTVLAMLAVGVMSLSLTACSSDDDDKNGDGPVTDNVFKVDGVSKNYRDGNPVGLTVYASHDFRHDFSLYISDGTRLDISAYAPSFGKRIDLTKELSDDDIPGLKVEFMYHYDPSELHYIWYGSNGDLINGSWVKIEKITDGEYEISGKIVYPADFTYGGIIDGKQHTVEFAYRGKVQEDN